MLRIRGMVPIASKVFILLQGSHIQALLNQIFHRQQARDACAHDAHIVSQAAFTRAVCVHSGASPGEKFFPLYAAEAPVMKRLEGQGGKKAVEVGGCAKWSSWPLGI